MYKDRPRREVESTPVGLALNSFAALAVLATWAYLWFRWSGLPELVPQNFSLDGTPESWGPKTTLLLLPAVMGVDLVLLTVLQRFPHTYNYLVRITEENAETQYTLAVRMMQWMNATMAVGFAVLEVGLVEAASGGSALPVTVFGPLFVGAMLVGNGYFLFRSWRNR